MAHIATMTDLSAKGAVSAMFPAWWMFKKQDVSREEEERGLDIDEHGMEAYYGFQIFTTE